MISASRKRWMNRLGGALLMALLMMGATACQSMDRAEAVRRMNEGLEAYQTGRTIDGVKLLKEAAQIDPTYAEPDYYLGQLYHFKLGEPTNAERHYQQALERDTENAQILYRLGMVLAEQGKHDEAVGPLMRAVEKKPDFAKAWFRLGLSREAEGQYADAVDAYMKSIEADARMKMDEEDPGGAAYHALGDLYIRFGFFDKAVKVYENAIENNEDVPRLHSGKGVAQLKLKRFPEAKASFEDALAIDEGQTTAIFNLAVAQMAMGETAQAVDGFEQFTVRADPAKDEARIVAAQGFVQQIKEASEAGEK